MKPKKPRGRPKGTVIPTDRRVLNSVADLLLSDPAMRPTTAIKQIVTDWTDSVVHRLMGKWRKEREALLAEARQRQEAKAAKSASAGSASVGVPIESLAAQMRMLQESPTLRAMNEMMNSPTMKAMREMADSPTMRAIREMQDSPTMRAIREMQNSPVMQLIREQQRLKRDLGFF